MQVIQLKGSGITHIITEKSSVRGVIFVKVKTRKQGNSLMVTIPASFGVPENAEYTPVMDENGTISFVPVHQNLFMQAPDYDVKAAMTAMGVGDLGPAVGRENVW